MKKKVMKSFRISEEFVESFVNIKTKLSKQLGIDLSEAKTLEYMITKCNNDISDKIDKEL